MTFGEALKRIRTDAGLTQAALAKKAGLSLRTVQGWESYGRSPVSPAFFKTVKALGCSADDFAGIGEPKARKKGK